MTYSIRMFGRSANPVAHLAYHELVSALTATDSTIAQVGDLHQGVGWVGFDVTSDRPGGPVTPVAPVHVEVSTRRDVLAACLDSDDAKAQGARLDDVNLMIELTLSGEPTDWQTVAALWTVTSQMWSAVAWDEASGFDARLDDLVT